MGIFSRKTKRKNIDWVDLNQIDQLKDIKRESDAQTIIILKHSTRCSISIMAKNRLDTKWDPELKKPVFYYLDLIKYRLISDQIAKTFKVIHESPQVLVIKNDTCTFSATHGNIDPRLLAKAI